MKLIFSGFIQGFVSLMIWFGCSLPLQAQVIESCQVGVAFEPRQEKVSLRPTKITQSTYSYLKKWNQKQEATISNDKKAGLTLPGFAHSAHMFLSEFGASIPAGATIHGIEVWIEGQSTRYTSLGEISVTLFGNNGSIISQNKANTALAQKAWSLLPDGSDKKWCYGGKSDNWGINWDTDWLNAPDFQLEIQLRNATSQTVDVALDDIEIVIHYTPLYAFCKDSCVVFYVDPFKYGKGYRWILPENFMSKSRENENTINLMAGNGATFGSYKICAEIYNGNGQTTDTCCRYFNYQDCAMGGIQGVAWEDANHNKQRDVGETTLAGITIQLKNLAGIQIREVTTQADGSYTMSNIPSGQYYLQSSRPDGKLFVLKDPGVPLDKNSEITQQNGPGTTDVIFLTNTMLTHMDFGFLTGASIGDFVWHDLNGNGQQDSGEPGLANISVTLLDNNQNVLSTTQTDPLGHYGFDLLLPGTYVLNFGLPQEYVATCKVPGASLNSDGNALGETEEIVLTSGAQSDSVDFGLFRYSNISGIAFEDLKADGDVDGQDAGVENILCELSGMSACGSEYIDTVFTKANGEYNFIDIPPGTYKIRFEFPASYYPTQPGSGSRPNRIDNDFSTQIFVLESGTQLTEMNAGVFRYGSVSGMVWNDENTDSYRNETESGVEGFQLELRGTNTYGNIIVKQTLTATNGTYAFDSLLPGSYWVTILLDSTYRFSPFKPDADTTRDNNSESGIIYGIQICSGIHISFQDCGVYEKASIGDFVWEDLNGNGIQEGDEPGLPGIEMVLTGTDFLNMTVQKSVITDLFGYYTFDGLDPGNYRIQVATTGAYTPTAKNAGSDNDIDSDINVFFRSDNINLVAGLHKTNLDAGLLVNGSVSGKVWEDMTCDGILSLQDFVLENRQVSLQGVSLAGFQINATALTNSSGAYYFGNLAPGIYDVSIDLTGGFLAQNPVIQSIVVQSGGQVSDVIFPLYRPAGLGDFIWFDENENGVQDGNEPGIDNVQIELTGIAGGLPVQSSMVSQNGYYYFGDLKPGVYQLSFIYPNDYTPTLKNAGADILVDSDINETGVINNIILYSADQKSDVDAGFIQASRGVIGDFVWLDSNGDGIQNDTEPGLAGVFITLDGVEDNGTIVQFTTVSDAAGFYTFQNLRNGTYSLQFVPPPGYFLTNNNLGNGTNDSKPDPVTGVISSIIINAGSILPDLDAGYYELATIGDLVWADQNKNGLQDLDEPGIEGILLNVYQADSNSLVGSMFSNVSGQYLISGIRPGRYFVLAELPVDKKITSYQSGNPLLDSDFYQSNDSVRTETFTIFSGQNVLDLDLGLVDKETSIEGFVWRDINANGIRENQEFRLADLEIFLLNEGGDTLSSTITDSTGYYFFGGLTTSLYKIKFPLIDSLTFTRYQAGSNPDIDSDVLDFNLGIVTLNIMLGDQVRGLNAGYVTKSGLGDFVWLDMNEDGKQDLNETGLNGVVVELYNLSNQLIGSQVSGLHPVTGKSGYYHFEDLFPGDYYLHFTTPNNLLFTLHDENAGSVNSDVTGVFGVGTTDTIVLGYQELQDTWDCGFIIDENALGQINGVVWQDVNANTTREITDILLEGVEVKLFDLSGVELAITFTDTAGRYKFDNLFFGSYYLMVPDVENRVFVLYNGMNPLTDSEITNEFGPGTSRIISLFPGDSLHHLDLGYAPKISLGDFVWEDVNNNGIQDNGEPGIAGILIQLLNQTGMVIDSRVTDAGGKYLFDDLAAGNYGLRAVVNGGYLLALSNVGPSDVDSKADLSGYIPNRDFLNAGDYDNLDIGLIRSATIGSRVWLDLNGNGIFSNNEPGIPDIVVELYDESGTFIKMTKTSATQGQDFVGSYSFKGIRPGNYFVKFKIPDQYLLSPSYIGVPESDSDITNIFGRGSTDLFSISVGEMKLTIDGAAYLPACIGDRVWNDVNQDGVQDPGEPGIENVLVSIFTSNGMLIDTVRTNSQGEYKFYNLRSRLYYLRFALVEGYEFTLPFQGNSASLDSDVDATGTTPLISLAHGSVFLDVDAGMFVTQNRIIFGTVWDDINKDGLKDEYEQILPKVRVNLTDASGNILSNVMTNHAGLYAHVLHAPGKYYIQVIEQENYRITQRAAHTILVCNDINLNGMSDPISFASSPEIQHKNGGMYYQPSTKLSGQVWLDVNQDKQWTVGLDSLMQDVVVLLFTQQNVFVKSTKTDENGFYELNGIDPGYYYVKIPVLDQKDFLLHSESSDSYITNEKGEGTSLLIMLNVQNPGVNFHLGYVKLPGVQEQPEEHGSRISVYPNPTIFNINVSFENQDDAVEYRLINASGKVIQQGLLVHKDNEIDLTDVPLGIYVLEMHTKVGVVRKKFFRAENY